MAPRPVPDASWERLKDMRLTTIYSRHHARHVLHSGCFAEVGKRHSKPISLVSLKLALVDFTHFLDLSGYCQSTAF